VSRYRRGAEPRPRTDAPPGRSATLRLGDVRVLKVGPRAADIDEVLEAPTPHDDRDRVTSLRHLGVLDTPAEERFDRITRLACRLLDVPIALVSLVDADRQWFKSRQGLETCETPRGVSFCGHAISAHDVLHVPDACADPRFADNPLVTGAPFVRFYAGSPIAAPDGSLVGTLCVIDHRPRQMNPSDLECLRDLASLVENELALGLVAMRDPLTGLSNRYGFDLLGRQAHDLCLRQHLPALVLFADVNGLKFVNDEFGHATGDRLLRVVGEIIGSIYRGADAVARLGGDEFAVYLSNCGTDDEPTVTGRLDEALAAANARLNAGPYRVSLAYGTAALDPEVPSSLESLLATADAAMYSAKRKRAHRLDLLR
jgi:diguanylate cyclase (GGDEF)-like protein